MILNFTQKVSEPNSVAPSYVYTTPEPTELNSEELWQIIQDWRTSQNLPKYILDERLCKIAKDRSYDPDDNHQTFLKKYSKYPYKIQEIAAYYITTEHQTLNGWLNSASHSAILRKSWVYSCAECTYTTCIQVFSNF